MQKEQQKQQPKYDNSVNTPRLNVVRNSKNWLHPIHWQ